MYCFLSLPFHSLRDIRRRFCQRHIPAAIVILLDTYTSNSESGEGSWIIPIFVVFSSSEERGDDGVNQKERACRD